MTAAESQSKYESDGSTPAPRWRVWTIRIVLALVAIALLFAVIGFFWLRYDLLNRMDPAALTGEQAPLASFAEDPPRSGPAPDLSHTLAKIDAATLLQPPDGVRPWTRWWWPGADVNPQQACKQLRALKARGFAGVEIQPFTADLATIEDADWRERCRRNRSFTNSLSEFGEILKINATFLN